MFILDINRGFSKADYTKIVQGPFTTFFQFNGRAQLN